MTRKAKAVGTATIDDAKIERMIASTPIEVWPLDDVILDTNNANIHDRRSIDAIKGSIAKFGQVEPLLIRKSTCIVIAGEGRWIAMQELGFTHVEVRPLDVDATTAAMLSLALNQTAKHSHFDFESVAAQLKGFKVDGQDISMLGWSDFELDGLMKGKASESTNVDSKADGKEYDETIADEVKYCKCPQCGHEWPI